MNRFDRVLAMYASIHMLPPESLHDFLCRFDKARMDCNQFDDNVKYLEVKTDNNGLRYLDMYNPGKMQCPAPKIETESKWLRLFRNV